MITKDNEAYLQLMADYYEKSWIFYDQIIFLSGDKKYTVDVKQSDKLEKTIGSSVRERYTWIPTDEFIGFLDIIITNDDGKFRFKGKQGNYDYIMSEHDKEALKEVLSAYHELTD